MGGQFWADGSQPTGQRNERGQGGGNGDNRAEGVHGVSPAGGCRPLLLGNGNPGWLVQLAVEAHQGSGWFLNLGCAVEQAQQAERREFGANPAKRLSGMEPIRWLACAPARCAGQLVGVGWVGMDRDGEVFVIELEFSSSLYFSTEC